MTFPIRALALATALLAAPAAPAIADDVAWAPQAIGSLSVPLPTGGGWTTQQSGDGMWQSLRIAQDADGNRVSALLIGVVPHPLPPQFHDWLPAEIATDYLRWEVANMQSGEAQGEYTLTNVHAVETRRGDRPLFVLHNEKTYADTPDTSLTFETQDLYLVFLPDFPETLTFYKIFLSAVCFAPECGFADLDLAVLDPVIDGIAHLPE
jgi:hypothetical protein